MCQCYVSTSQLSNCKYIYASDLRVHAAGFDWYKTAVNCTYNLVLNVFVVEIINGLLVKCSRVLQDIYVLPIIHQCVLISPSMSNKMCIRKSWIVQNWQNSTVLVIESTHRIQTSTNIGKYRKMSYLAILKQKWKLYHESRIQVSLKIRRRPTSQKYHEHSSTIFRDNTETDRMMPGIKLLILRWRKCKHMITV